METIHIGNQEWMIDNLNVNTFRNGDPIPCANSIEEFIELGKEGKPAYCIYDNDPKNEQKYGKLYNYFSVIDPRGLAPEGFHVPTYEDIDVLSKFVNTNGSKLKSEKLWKGDSSENESGFTALPAGKAIQTGVYKNIKESGDWWVSPTLLYRESDSRTFSTFSLVAGRDNIVRVSTVAESGLSIRCLKNKIPSNQKLDGSYSIKLYDYGIHLNLYKKPERALLCYEVIWKLKDEIDRNLLRTFISFDPKSHELKIMARGKLSRERDGFYAEDKYDKDYLYATNDYPEEFHQSQMYYDNAFMPKEIEISEEEFNNLVLVEKQNWWNNQLPIIRDEILKRKDEFNDLLNNAIAPYLIK